MNTSKFSLFFTIPLMIAIVFVVVLPATGWTAARQSGSDDNTLYLDPGDYPADPLVERIGDVADVGFDFIDPSTGMEFVRVEGWCFQMGDTFGDGGSDEQPVHEVCVDDFYMGKYEVTIDQYRQYLQATGNTGGVDWDDDDCPLRNNSSYSLSGNKFGDDDNKPMVEVSWEGARDMARWLSRNSRGEYRLPTEAEWEYAARSGGKREKYSGGNNVDEVAWYDGNSNDRTHRVGTKAANGLGLHDMSGNVYEWCSDRYDSDYYGTSPRNNPEGPSSGSDRVFRGGGWDGDSRIVRSAYRNWYWPDGTNDGLGFRLVFAEGNR